LLGDSTFHESRGSAVSRDYPAFAAWFGRQPGENKQSAKLDLEVTNRRPGPAGALRFDSEYDKFQGMGRTSFHLVFVLCFLSKVACTQGTPGANIDIEERVFTGSKVYSLLQLRFFPAKGAPAPDLDDSYKAYLHKVLTTDDRRQFDLATIEFVAQLHSGHTFFWDAWLNKSNNQPLGFYAIPLEGKWVVETSVVGDLKPGDVISTIGDTNIEAFFLQQRRYISASSRAAERRNLFLYPYLFPEQFTLTLEDSRKVEIDRATMKKAPEKIEARWVKAGATAYIRIPSFFDPSQEEQALDFVRQFHKAKALILDVRNNPGGIPPERLIRVLMDRPYRGWVESTTASLAMANTARQAAKNEPDDSRGVPNAAGNLLGDSKLVLDGQVITASPNAFRGRLILLVDGGCVSACEDLVEPSKESGRATLVGETTQGSSGLPFIYDFKNGMSLRIAVKRYCFPDGSEFEGVGIKPDIEVHTTIKDLKNGRDLVLEKALDLAAKP